MVTVTPSSSVTVFFLPYGLTEPILGSTTYFAIMLWQTSIAFLSVRAHTIVGSRR